MHKVKIKVITLGSKPKGLDLTKIEGWSSELFLIDGQIENYELRCDSDGGEWEYTDQQLLAKLPRLNADFIFAIVNVPLEKCWYSRRVDENKIVFTFHEIVTYLENSNIHLYLAAIKALYSYTLIFLESNNRIPACKEGRAFWHDETRGCLFDMNGFKTDIVASSDNPIICGECLERLKKNSVSNEVIRLAQREIKRIRKDLYYRVINQIKAHPIISLIISSLFAIVLGSLGSLIGSYFFERIKQ